MSNDLTISNEFTATRYVGKNAKAVTRGALGVIMSGNRAELDKLGKTALSAMIANGNFRHAMLELDRVFPAKSLAGASNVSVKVVKGEDPIIHFMDTAHTEDGRTLQVLERYEGWTKANKHVFKNFARAVAELAVKASAAGKPFKGEKMKFAAALADWLEADEARIAAKEAALADEIAKLEASIVS